MTTCFPTQVLNECIAINKAKKKYDKGVPINLKTHFEIQYKINEKRFFSKFCKLCIHEFPNFIINQDFGLLYSLQVLKLSPKKKEKIESFGQTF